MLWEFIKLLIILLSINTFNKLLYCGLFFIGDFLWSV